MRKSKAIILLTVFTSAVTACVHSHNQWISGEENGICRDTCINEISYRFYRGAWYPVYNDLINPGIYIGGSHIGSFSSFYHATARTGGFGKSAHSSHVSG